MDLGEAHAVGVIGGDRLGIDELADRVGLELLGGAHPLRRLLPVAEAVDLELDVVAVGIGVVVGERHPVVEAQRRGDPGLLEAQVARVQVLEARVLERRVVHPRARVLLRVLDEVREREQRDPVIRAVVGQPRADLVLEDDLGTDERAVEVDHLLQAGRLEVDVVERGVDHGVGHVRAPEVVGVVVM